ncbi:hypothetical protein GGI43DRAFT_343197 [Trichoderma evansii]
MDRLQDISRHLLAAGGTPSKDGKTTHLTYEEEGSIRMRTWTGSELIDDELIADEVRPGTSAPIVNRSHKKVFVVHKNHSIKCFTDPLRDDEQVDEDEIDDDAPWNEEKIIGVDTRVHQRSQLAVSYDKNTVFVFFQKPDGSLGAINEYNNKWKAVKLPAVAALDGTPLASCNTSSAVYLFYISVDGTVRYMQNSEGGWKDVFFSEAEIIDPDPNLPGPTFKLTIAEDRQVFERIRPMVFCLKGNILSVIKFHSMDLETIGTIEGTELVPLLGSRERNRYYFWSPYPFYVMNKRSPKSQAQATTPRRFWSQYMNRSSPASHQQECGNSNAMKHLSRLQEPFVASRKASMVNNKTPATVSVETTNAQAIISPQKSEQNGISCGTPAGGSLFAGFCSFLDPVIETLFGNGHNENATEEDALGNSRSNRADIVDVSPETNETEINGMENHDIESNEVNAGGSEIEEAGPKETELEVLENEDIKMNGTEVDKPLFRDDGSEEADSEGTDEDTDLEGTDSEEAETTPSEIEEDQTEEAQTKEVQTDEVQKDEVRKGEVQKDEVQKDKVQIEEVPTEKAQTEEAQTNDAKLKEFEAEISTVGEIEREIETKEQEPKNVKCIEIEPETNLDKAEVSTTEISTTETSTTKTPGVGSPVEESSVTKGCGKEPDIEESGLKVIDSEESERTEIPTIDEEKGPTPTDTPISKGPIFNTAQDVQEDLTKHIKKMGLGSVIREDSPFISTVSDNAIKLKNSEGNLLNRDVDIQGITRLNIYQPVLYCDDSTSMRAGTRVKDQKEMVRRVTRISTSLVPSGHGTSLQFINHDLDDGLDVHNDTLSHIQVEAIMNSVEPSGHTEIGTNLKKKILKPLVYDVIKKNKRLERPILVSCITDGCPTHESPDMFKKEILKCTQFLKKKGYPPSIIRFQISQIGNSSKAGKFLQELNGDPELQEVLYVTAQHLDDKFEEFRDNEVELERWLLRTLLEPINGRRMDTSKLNLQPQLKSDRRR